MKKQIKILVALLPVSMLVPLVSVQTASADQVTNKTIVSSRSFVGTNKPRKDLLAESVSVPVETGTWENHEDYSQLKALGEQQTAKLQKEKEEKEAEEAQQKAQAAQAAQSGTSSQVSRSEVRNDITTNVAASDQASALIAYASTFVGGAYVWGGTNPQPAGKGGGADCSGYVQAMFAHFGYKLPRLSGDQANAGTPVASIADAIPGDIIANAEHVGIYIGNGQTLEAMNPKKGIGFSTIAYFPGAYSIRRIL